MKTALLAIFLTLLVGAFSVYQFEQFQKFETETNSAIHHLNTEIPRSLNKLQNTMQTITQLEHFISKQQQNSNQSFSFDEIQYGLRLAYERLITTRDVDMAIHLLKSVDNQLKSKNDPSLLALREALANDLNKLKTLKMPDIEGLWVNIGSLIEEVPNLPIQGLKDSKGITDKNSTENTTENTKENTKKNTNEKTTSQESPANWRLGLKRAWEQLKDLVKIQRHDKPIEPILEPSEQRLAKEHLTLLLEQIRFAVLTMNNAIYPRLINETIQWLEKYFEPTDSRVQQMIAQLKELSQINLKPNLPEFQSLQQANKYKG